MAKKILLIFLITFPYLYISCSGGSKRIFISWYVKPYDPNGVNGNGMSYCEAWNGIENIDWSQIEPGDTIYLCGTFTKTVEIKRSGDIGYNIKISGKCPRSDCGQGEGGIEKGIVMPVIYTIENWGEGIIGDNHLKPPSDSGILFYRGEELKRGIPLAIVRDEALYNNETAGFVKLTSPPIAPYNCGSVCPDDNDTDFLNYLDNIFNNLGENQFYYERCCNVIYWKPSPTAIQKLYVVKGTGLRLKDISNIYISEVIFIGGDTSLSLEGSRVDYIYVKNSSFKWSGTGIGLYSKALSYFTIERNSFNDNNVAIHAKECNNISNITLKKNRIHGSAEAGLYIESNLENIRIEENTFSSKGLKIKSCEVLKNVNINYNHIYNVSTSALDIDTSTAVNPEVLNIQYNLIRNSDTGIILKTYDREFPYIYNNTFYNNGIVLKWISSPSQRKPAFYFINNLLYNTTNYQVYMEATDSYENSPLLINSNVYYTDSTADPQFYINGEELAFRRWKDRIRFYTQNNTNEADSTDRDEPSLVNETGRFSEIKDFKLSCNSALIDRGSEPPGLQKRDFFGGKVPVRKPDIGFHEFQGEICP